jgi:hypothetical protein
MTLGPGFRRKAQESFGGVRGCRHMNELLPVEVAVAIQTVFAKRNAAMPLFENQCHTWRSEGPDAQAVKRAVQESACSIGDDEDLKGAALLFASDAGKHITGQVLAIDGGITAVN